MGQILMIIGLAGMGVTAVASIVSVIVLSRGRKRLRKKMNQEYGCNLK